MDTVYLENPCLRVTILKDFGAKMTSIYRKDTDEEFLFQPEAPYKIPKLGDDFSLYDTSGIDDCFPTVDSCVVKGLFYPDHGSLWSIPWSITETSNTMVLQVIDPITQLAITKRLLLCQNKIHIYYEFFNPTAQSKDFLWVFHGLFQMNGQLLLPLPSSLMVRVHGKPGNFNMKHAKEYPMGESFKWYFPDPIPLQGPIGYLTSKSKVLFHYDRKKIPYLGLWVTTGEFKGQTNWALEPSTGFYDSLKKAISTNTHIRLHPKKYFTFCFTIEIKEVPWLN